MVGDWITGLPDATSGKARALHHVNSSLMPAFVICQTKLDGSIYRRWLGRRNIVEGGRNVMERAGIKGKTSKAVRGRRSHPIGSGRIFCHSLVS